MVQRLVVMLLQFLISWSQLNTIGSKYTISKVIGCFRTRSEWPRVIQEKLKIGLSRDLGLSRDASQILGRHFALYRKRLMSFVLYFSSQGSLVYCNNIPAVIKIWVQNTMICRLKSICFGTHPMKI